MIGVFAYLSLLTWRTFDKFLFIGAQGPPFHRQLQRRSAIKPETTEDILELMNGTVISTVLGAAMEWGGFWLLAEKPLSVPEIAQALDEKFAPSKTGAPPSRLLAAFLKSLESSAPSVDYITTEVVQTRLQQAGFRDISITPVPHKDNLPWNIDWTLIEAKKETNV